MDELDVLQARLRVGGGEVIDLSADQAPRSDRTGQTCPHGRTSGGIRKPHALSERLGQESTGGQNGRGLVEGNVDRGLSPADGVIVLGRHVIEHERAGVDQVHCARNRHGRLGIRARSKRSAERQRRTQAFAARKDGITHGTVKLSGVLRRGR